MIWLLKMMIFGHVHKWQQIKEVAYKEWFDRPAGQGIPDRIATKYVCRCETCGQIKAFIP